MTEIVLLPSVAGPSQTKPQSLPLELDQVVRLVDAKPESLARGDAEMYAAALAATKMIYGIALDTEKSAAKPISKLLRGLTPGEDAPTTRAQKRKRDDTAKPPPLVFRPTPKAGRLGAGVDGGWNAAKLWEQMEYRAGPLCGILEAVVAPEDIIEEEDEEEETEEELEGDEGGEIVFDEDEDGADYSLSEDEDEDEDEEDEDESESDEDESDGGESHLGETTMELSRGGDHSGSSDEEDGDEEEEELPAGGYLDGLDLDREENPQKAAKKRAHPTLDDGFFSIDAFNRETEALEAQSRSSGALNDDDDDEEEDVDIFMNVEDVEDNEDDVNDPQYKDFFAPPPKPKKAPKLSTLPKPGSPSKPKRKLKLLVASPPKRSTVVRFNEEVRVRNIKSKRTRASLLAELAEAEEDEDGEEEGEEGAWMSEMLDGSEGSDESEDGDDSEDSAEEDSEGGKAKGDLFAEDEPTDENGVALSSYQQRLADLSAEIKALEAENVAPKPWALQGEATARSRPQNALLSADLEFEHVGKVVPIVTEEAVKKLEDRIKARVIEGRYDDVVRKRETDAKPFLPSRMFELKDTQSEKSLAQIYEDEYTASRGGASTGPVDDRDGKLAQEHKEIEELWDGISYKLDALSNAHFTPKQPKAQITTVSNIASASMESALPTSLSTSTLLAPEEVYAPTAGDARAKGELTPGEKRAARTKERKKRRKQRDALSSAVDKFGANGAVSGRGAPRNVKEAKNQALKGLVKNGKGVTVVGKDASRAAGKGKGIKETSAKSKDEGPARDSKKFKL